MFKQQACASCSTQIFCVVSVLYLCLIPTKIDVSAFMACDYRLHWPLQTSFHNHNCTAVYKLLLQRRFSSEAHQSLYKKFHVIYRPKIHYHAGKSPPLDSILGQPKWVTTITPCVFRIHFNIVLFWCTSPSRSLLLSSTETVRIFMSAVRYPRHQVVRHLVTVNVLCTNISVILSPAPKRAVYWFV